LYFIPIPNQTVIYLIWDRNVLQGCSVSTRHCSFCTKSP
jgi:hypothetical protein